MSFKENVDIYVHRSRAHQIVAVPDTSLHQKDSQQHIQSKGRSLQFLNPLPEAAGGIQVIQDRSFSVNVPQHQTILDPLSSFTGNGIAFARDHQGIIRPVRIIPISIPQNQQLENNEILNPDHPAPLSRKGGQNTPGLFKLPDEFYQTNFNTKSPGPQTCLCNQVPKSQFGIVFEAVPLNKRIFRKRRLSPKTRPKSRVCWNRGFKYTCSSVH